MGARFARNRARSRASLPPCDGIVLADKPVGASSNEVLQQVKRLFRARKGGHSGSLDPFASGMLPICLGEATKVAGTLLDARKHYRFTIELGARTASGDLEQPVIETRPVPAVDEATLDATLRRFVGTIEQVPPMFSALKHEGQRLYRLARRGVEIERIARKVTVHSLERELEESRGSRLTLRVTCSKGTYIRTLAEDIAAALGTVGHVSALRRVWVEPFEHEVLHPLEQLTAFDEEGRRACLLPIDRALQAWPRVDLDAEQARRLVHGQKVTTVPAPGAGPARAYGPEGAFLGIADRDETGLLAPRRLLATP